MATLCHPTLPWFGGFTASISIAGVPLADMSNAGARDRLSLVGQYAAHLALLQFAGVADGEFDPSEWVVVRKRGSDCHLVRISARANDDATPPALLSIQQFAEVVHSPALDVLRQSWTRAETVFAEVHRRLRSDAAADMRWMQRAAAGEIRPPGPETLAAMWATRGPHRVADADAFRALAVLDDSTRLAVVGSEFPIQRYAALASLDESLVGSSLTPAAVADRILARLAETRHVIVVCGHLDEQSARALEMLGDESDACDITPVRRWLAISTRVGAQQALAATPTLTRSALDAFVTSNRYTDYLDRGTVPVEDGAFAATPEPRRSFIAALALLGERVPAQLARDFLKQFLFEHPLEQLAIDGITSVENDEFRFVSEALREHCARHIPAASRAALCRSAASVADPCRAGLLLLDAGDVQEALQRLEEGIWKSSCDIVDTLSAVPRTMLTPRLAALLGNALVDGGRYRDARDLASMLDESDRELLLARCERRTGDYATALARLDRISAPSYDAAILRGVLLRLTGDYAKASAAFESVNATSTEQKTRLAYERALLALESGEHHHHNGVPSDHYFGRRLATYRALETDEFDVALALAAQSVAAARCATERIDACLDRVFASFSTGRWDDTRALALESLAIVDEAQGDRAAAGILFTLTFLEIDDGRWSSAAQHIRRLRDYYSTTSDEFRLGEIDLLTAYLEFARGRFDEARRVGLGLLERHHLIVQIREAAALIVDEVDWLQHRHTALRSTGHASNRELDDRHRLMARRRGESQDSPATPFMAALAQWELSPAGDPPRTRSRSEKLKLFRSALALSREHLARSLAEQLSITMPDAAPPRAGADIEMLRIAASADYPFRDDVFTSAWCHATRNRLGQWSQDGSRKFEPELLDRVASSLEADWLHCSERELLYVEDCGSWSEASREAIAAIFRTRAENHRLRRILDQEEAPAVARREERADGIVGESGPMRSVFSLIERIAPRDVPVCVLGESGTGKELVGRAIHRSSPRRQKTFTAINCAALPENLIESELFGHVRGAFTGADRDRAGVIETTDGGTLFLDEIGEMPLTAQAKLLRFLQDGEFRRVGDTVNRTADVRIVSATNRKLETAVEEGRFREDLYYRIRGVDVVLPPLRERGDDVLLLAHHFLARERARHKSGPQKFSSEVETLLQSYSWPGNVRELQNTIRAAHAMAAEGREIDIEHLPERLRNVRPARVAAGSYQDAVARFRRDLIEKSLNAAAGNQNRAAAMLKISRQALAYQIRELGIMVGKTKSLS